MPLYDIDSYMKSLLTTVVCVSLFLGATIEVWAAGRLRLLRQKDPERISLQDLADMYGLCLCTGAEGQAVLSNKYTRLVFEPKKRRMEYNGVQLYMNAHVKENRGTYFIHKTDLDTVLDPLLRPHTHLANIPEGPVVLDAGHGGHDPGALSPGGLKEKDITLDLALRTAEILKEQGVVVELTRDQDTFIPLKMRADLTEAYHAGLFVSIHCNAAENPQAEGVETYYITAPGFTSTQAAPEAIADEAEYSGNHFSSGNSLLAYLIQQNILRESQRLDRGVRHARFAVLKGASCPAVLVECGFLSNIKGESLLGDPLHRERLAKGLADGIIEFKNRARKAKLVHEP